MEVFLSIDSWLSLLTLTFLEIVLGVDNIIFISLLVNKLPESKRNRTMKLGLFFAMLQRIILLMFASFLMSLKEDFYSINLSWITLNISGESLILFGGGVFLIYKSVKEIYEKIEHKKNNTTININKNIALNSFSKIMVQILIVDFIFSIDSILTALGMVSGIGNTPFQSLLLMSIAVIVAILVMMLFANGIREFIHRHPSIQILGIAFLILIGFMLITEAAHNSNFSFFGNKVGHISKGYLYFAILFSLFVEFINIKTRKSNTN